MPETANNYRLNSNLRLKSKFDTDGAWTGNNIYDKYEKPVQDADDL